MASLPFVANVVKVQINSIAGVSKGANIFHLKYSGTPPSSANLTTLANAIATQYIARFATLLHTGFALKNFIATDLTSITSARSEGTLSGGGSASGTIMSGNVACVVSWGINLRYRGGHPRTYFYGFPTTQATDSSTWGSGFLTAMGVAAAAFLADLNALTTGGNTWQMGSVDYWNHGAHPPALLVTPVFYPFQSATVHPRIDTQRRRLGKEPI